MSSRSAALIALLFSVPILAFADEAPPAAPAAPAAPQPTLDEALAIAKRDGKPLVIDFYTTWCKPCRILEQKIFPDPAVQSALATATFIRYDAEDGPGIPAALRYKVSSYPTILVLDSAGNPLARFIGAPATPAPFARFLTDHIPLALDESTITARLADKQASPASVYAAGRWLDAHNRRDEALKAYDRAAKSDKGNKTGIAAAATWRASKLRRGKDGRARLAKDAADFILAYPATDEAGEALPLALLSGELPLPRIKKLVAARAKAVWDDAAALNGLAYLALAAGDYDGAVAAAERQITLKPDDPNVYDTLAETYHYRGDKAKALAAADKGIERTQDPQFKALLQKNRERFERGGTPPEPSSDVEANKRRANQTFAAIDDPIGGGGPAGEPDASDPSAAAPAVPTTTPEQDAAELELRAFMIGVRRAYQRVRDKCSADAGALTEVYVRLELPAAGGTPSRVVVLEPDATPKLRRCIETTLASEKLARPPLLLGGRYVAPVSFPGAGAAPKKR